MATIDRSSPHADIGRFQLLIRKQSIKPGLVNDLAHGVALFDYEFDEFLPHLSRVHEFNPEHRAGHSVAAVDIGRAAREGIHKRVAGCFKKWPE